MVLWFESWSIITEHKTYMSRCPYEGSFWKSVVHFICFNLTMW